MSSQTKDERLKEVSLATIDAKLWGCGFLMFLPDNSFKHVPLNKIAIIGESILKEDSDEDIHTEQRQTGSSGDG